MENATNCILTFSDYTYVRKIAIHVDVRKSLEKGWIVQRSRLPIQSVFTPHSIGPDVLDFPLRQAGSFESRTSRVIPTDVSSARVPAAAGCDNSW